MSVRNPFKLTFPNKPLSIFALAIGVFPTILAEAATPPAQTVTLGWDAVPEEGVQGYRVHVGGETQQYTESYEAGTDLTIPIEGLEFGKTYYFAVTAIGSNGVESRLSTELVVTIAPPPLPVGTNIVSNGTGQRGLQWSFPRAELGSSPDFIVQTSIDLVNWVTVGTVSSSQSSGGDAKSVFYSWPIDVSGARKFYRLTARNWLGSSTR